MNTYTVTIADAHSHSVSRSGIAGTSKLDALRSLVEAWANEPQPLAFSTFTTTDTYTITITQP